MSGRCSNVRLGAAWVGAVLAFAATPRPALHAHPLTPASLALRERPDGAYDVRFRTTRARPRGERLLPALPSTCDPVSGTERESSDAESMTVEYVVRCSPPLVGASPPQTLGVRGLASSPANVVVEVVKRDGRRLEAILDAGRPQLALEERRFRASPGFGSFLRLGAEHFAGGLDHVLFVLGLALAVRGLSRLAALVTAFTVGHSVSLALATVDFVRVPAAPVEAAIALSLVWVALRVLAAKDEQAPRSARTELLVTASIGLVHGLGFAGALAEAGSSAAVRTRALLGFNLGIEVSQLAFVALASMALAAVRRRPNGARIEALVLVVAAHVVGAASFALLFDRVPTLIGR